jgi:hypothetical protein
MTLVKGTVLEIVAEEGRTIMIKVSEPINLCPYHSNPEVWRVLNKKIDLAMGLDLPTDQKAALQHGEFLCNTRNKSINQTSNWVNFVPMFLNIEVKKKYSEDPMIQLATWIAAEFAKRQQEGYSLDMPVFAIEIEGDAWNLWIGYWAGSFPHTLVFMGPESMGDTKSLKGAFKIFYVLQGLAAWGTSSYRAWFEREVLAKYQASPKTS